MVRITCSQMSAGNSTFTGREKYKPQQKPALVRCVLKYISSSGHHTLKKKSKGESELDGGQH